MDLLALLLPQRCSVCARPGKPLCSVCADALPRLRDPLCARCGAPTAWPVTRCNECSGRRLAFATARAAIAYDTAAAALVRAWKDEAIRKLAPAAADIVVAALPRPPVHAIAFVPPDAERSLKRGQHPAERLALELGRRWELPVVHALGRTRAVRAQRGLPRAERRRNVRGAFRPLRDDLPRKLALLDDVYTTGATVSAAASALHRGGARDVSVITFARTVRAAS